MLHTRQRRGHEGIHGRKKEEPRHVKQDDTLTSTDETGPCRQTGHRSVAKEETVLFSLCMRIPPHLDPPERRNRGEVQQREELVVW